MEGPLLQSLIIFYASHTAPSSYAPRIALVVLRDSVRWTPSLRRVYSGFIMSLSPRIVIAVFVIPNDRRGLRRVRR